MPQVNNYKKVLNCIRDYIADTGYLPDKSAIKNNTSLSKSTIKSILTDLVGQGQIKIIFKDPGKPTIYIPVEMYEALKQKTIRPDWIKEYTFDKKLKLQEEIQDKENEISRYYQVENLLCSTGSNLEESICEAFQIIKLEKLECLDNPEKWDFSFKIDNTIYICEAKGKDKSAKKDDVGQLDQWLQNYLEENPKVEPSNLEGLLIVNHYKNKNPQNRWPKNSSNLPITSQAERFLKFGHKKSYITTENIYWIAKKILAEELDADDAISELKDKFKREV